MVKIAGRPLRPSNQEGRVAWLKAAEGGCGFALGNLLLEFGEPDKGKGKGGKGKGKGKVKGKGKGHQGAWGGAWDWSW